VSEALAWLFKAAAAAPANAAPADALLINQARKYLGVALVGSRLRSQRDAR
jgi:hypothetical protein